MAMQYSSKLAMAMVLAFCILVLMNANASSAARLVKRTTSESMSKEHVRTYFVQNGLGRTPSWGISGFLRKCIPMFVKLHQIFSLASCQGITCCLDSRVLWQDRSGACGGLIPNSSRNIAKTLYFSKRSVW